MLLINIKHVKTSNNFLMLYNYEQYNNFFEYLLYNFIIYFVLTFPFTNYLISLVSGILNYYCYRLKSINKIKIIFFKNLFNKLIIQMIVILFIILLSILFHKYNYYLTNNILVFLHLICIVLATNLITIIIYPITKLNILLINLIIIFIILVLDYFSFYITIIIILLSIINLIKRKEFIIND
jgi:hypothetical protein